MFLSHIITRSVVHLISAATHAAAAIMINDDPDPSAGAGAPHRAAPDTVSIPRTRLHRPLCPAWDGSMRSRKHRIW